MVHLTHIKTKMKKHAFRNKLRKCKTAIVFIPRLSVSSASLTNGISYPPKYKVAKMTELINTLIYSANRKNPNFMDEYSEWYPPINSFSASGKSNGVRLVSAKAQTKKMMNPTGCKMIFQ